MTEKIQRKKFEKPELIDLNTTPAIGYGLTVCETGSVGATCPTWSDICSGWIP